MQIQLRSLSFNFISLSPLWGLVRLYCFCLMHLRLLKYDRVFTTYRWVFRKPAKGDLNGCFHTWFLCKATPVNKKNARFKASGADVKRSATSWLGIHASHSRLWVSVLKPTLNRHASQLVSPFLFCLRIISSAIANGMKFGSCRSPCWPGESRTRSTDRWNASKCHKPWPISCALREIEVDSSRKLPISLCSTERDGVFLHFWPLMPPPCTSSSYTESAMCNVWEVSHARKSAASWPRISNRLWRSSATSPLLWRSWNSSSSAFVVEENTEPTLH